MTPDPAQSGATPPPSGPAATPPHWGAIPPAATSGGDGQSQSWASQSAPTHFGYVTDPASHGTWDNGDGGEKLATADQVDALHAKLGEVHQSLIAMANSGQVGGAPPAAQNSNLQGLTPSRMPNRMPDSPLAASAAQREAANQQAAGAQQNLKAGQARTQATFAARQAQGGMRPTQPTGNGMGSSTAESSMSGALPGSPMRPNSGIGQSASSYGRSRFGQQ